MADPTRRVPTNAPGPVFVDTTCIDCGTCRWMAPDVFDADRGRSRVHTQPAELLPALQALVACPTGSIGVRPRASTREASRSFPRPLHPSAPQVLHCGFHAEASFGAASWLLLHPTGNVLVDSPRFSRPLADRITALGGARWMFLTHRDDVADHDRWARELGCERWLHRRDHRGQDIERVFEGDVALADGLQILETPGHTEGSACLQVGDVLFSGDHVAWSRTRGHLVAFDTACWYSWPTQIASMERLAGRGIRHVVPGHGAPAFDLPDGAIDACIRWMRTRRAG